MGKEAWNGAQEWMVENLEWREVDELWIQVGRDQGHLLSHKQFLSAFFLKEITCITNAVKKTLWLSSQLRASFVCWLHLNPQFHIWIL